MHLEKSGILAPVEWPTGLLWILTYHFSEIALFAFVKWSARLFWIFWEA